MSDDVQPTFREHLKKEIAGFLWLGSGLYVLLSLLSFHAGDPSFNNNLHPAAVHNYGGTVGAHLADLCYQLFGLPALLLPAVQFLFAWRLLKFRDVHVRLYKTIAVIILLFSLSGLFALHWQRVTFFGQPLSEAGGATGRLLVDTLSGYLNLGGATLFLAVFFLVALILPPRFSLVLCLEGILGRFGLYLQRRGELRREQKSRRQPARRGTAAAGPGPAAGPPRRPWRSAGSTSAAGIPRYSRTIRAGPAVRVAAGAGTGCWHRP